MIGLERKQHGFQRQGNQSFGAILNHDFVDISFDTDELSQKFWDMAEKNNWNCLILENPENGHIHSYWKDTEHRIEKGGKDKKLAVGIDCRYSFRVNIHTVKGQWY